MTDFTEKKSRLEADHRKKLAELATAQKCEGLLTERVGRAPLQTHVFAAYAQACGVYDADSIQDALEFAERVQPMTIYKVKSGTVAFKPTLTDKDEGSATVECIGPWYLDAKTFRHTPTKWTLSLFVEFDGEPEPVVVEIRITINADKMREDGYSVTYDYKPPSKYAPDGTVENCVVHYPRDHFTTANRYWATEGQPNDFKLY